MISSFNFDIYSFNNHPSKTLLERISTLDQTEMDYPWSIQAFFDLLNQQFRNYYLLTVTLNDEVVAFALVRCVKEEELCHLIKIAVGNNWRGQGIAYNLIKRLFTYMSELGIEKYYLEVAENNLSAINLYQKCGLIQKHLNKGFYSDGKNALIMSRP